MSKIYNEVKLSTVEIKGEGEKIKVTSPYSPLFVDRARKLGGEWIGQYKAWYFNPKDIERVKEMCNEVYGTFGNPVETVDMELKLDNFEDDSNDLYIKGIKIASRRNRDAPVSLGNCIIKKGGFSKSGGSINNPRLDWKDETVLEARNIPKKIAEELVEEDNEKYSIIRENDNVNKKEHGWLVTFLNKEEKPTFYSFKDKEKMIEELPEIKEEALREESIMIIEPGVGFSLESFN